MDKPSVSFIGAPMPTVSASATGLTVGLGYALIDLPADYIAESIQEDMDLGLLHHTDALAAAEALERVVAAIRAKVAWDLLPQSDE